MPDYVERGAKVLVSGLVLSLLLLDTTLLVDAERGATAWTI
ncbi:MAG: hypothetical protein ACRDYA_24815 [Egibacteraceae bacterium]